MHYWKLLGCLMAFGPCFTEAVDGYQAKCSITEGNGIEVDSCDATKFLKCQSGRCMCSDVGNQLYDYQLELVPSTSRRKRRSPKNKKKKIAAGVLAGAAVGYVAGRQSPPSSSLIVFKKRKAKRVYACYGRVGSPCLLDFNNVNVVTLPPTTSEAPPSTTVAATNETMEKQSPPSATPLDISKIPKCVRNAECVPTQGSKPVANTNNTSSHVFHSLGDPRVGVCMCRSGYAANAIDKCEVGAAISNYSNTNWMVVLAALVVARF